MFREPEMEAPGGPVPPRPSAGRALTGSRGQAASGIRDFSGGIGPGVPVETSTGPLPAGEIRPGMRLRTLQNGYQTVLWVGQESPAGPGREVAAMPVGLGPKALGRSGQPDRLLLAPGQYLRLRHPLSQIFFASDDILCRASGLTHLPGIARALEPGPVAWVHILFDRLELLRAGGLWLESMRPDLAALRRRRRQRALAAGIEAALPALRFECGLAAYARQMPVLERRELRMLGDQELSA